jgi:hypothetical protein
VTISPPVAPPSATAPAATARPAALAPAAPAGPVGPGPRRRRLTTPVVLRAGMALVCLPIVVFAVAVHVGVARDHSTVDTVGHDATRGITVAQEIKSNLAELDGIVVQDLLEPAALAASGYPDDYDTMRRALDQNLVLAASEAPPGSAFHQPLVNIDYALGHFHALVRESFAAGARGDSVLAATLYAQAHDVMDGTLLPQADFFDKANTYVLNGTYDSHKADSASIGRLIVVSWLALLALLLVVQGLLVWRFRRVLNVALAAATVICALTGVSALSRLDMSASDMAAARDQAFDPVHQLARARAAVVSARQAEGLWLLDPTDPSAQAKFTTRTHRVFRVQDVADVTSVAQAGEMPVRAGGYLATVGRTHVSVEGDTAATDALLAFGGFLAEDAHLRQQVAAGDVAGAEATFRSGEAFHTLTDAIDAAQAADQATFDAHVGSAVGWTRHLDAVNLLAAVAMALLVSLGLYLRIREYQD